MTLFGSQLNNLKYSYLTGINILELIICLLTLEWLQILTSIVYLLSNFKHSIKWFLSIYHKYICFLRMENFFQFLFLTQGFFFLGGAEIPSSCVVQVNLGKW